MRNTRAVPIGTAEIRSLLNLNDDQHRIDYIRQHFSNPAQFQTAHLEVVTKTQTTIIRCEKAETYAKATAAYLSGTFLGSVGALLKLVNNSKTIDASEAVTYAIPAIAIASHMLEFVTGSIKSSAQKTALQLEAVYTLAANNSQTLWNQQMPRLVPHNSAIATISAPQIGGTPA